MSDLHDRFRAWLTDGARTDLPRDAALHASACDACLRDAAAFDALLAIEPGAAPLPPVAAGTHVRSVRAGQLARAAAGVVAVAALAVSVGIGAGALLDRRADVGATLSSPTPQGEGILAGAGGASNNPEPTSSEAAPSEEPSRSPEPSEASETDEPGPTPVPAVATPRPVITPRPTSITPPIGTPRPSGSAAATPAPTAPPSAPPSATPPVETATPTPTPTPTPAPTPPPPPQCSDGVDNDGDLLT
ncbi:MAG: hypothetical protein M3Y40_00695, partial [Chloroflexota bacterium]|nr:hypothetical protein [Chloroflexota bacterium]